MEVKMPAAEMVDISLLKPYKKNTKKHNQTQIDNVAESIRKFGFVQPFVIDKNNEVVIGHCRLLAAQKLGIKELPCVRVDYLTAAQVKALRILDNKLNESEWDLDFLNEELPEIDLAGFDVDFPVEVGGVLDALLENGVRIDKGLREGDSGTFVVSFAIPNEYDEQVHAFIRKNGKEPLVACIVEACENGD